MQKCAITDSDDYADKLWNRFLDLQVALCNARSENIPTLIKALNSVIEEASINLPPNVFSYCPSASQKNNWLSCMHKSMAEAYVKCHDLDSANAQYRQMLGCETTVQTVCSFALFLLQNEKYDECKEWLRELE